MDLQPINFKEKLAAFDDHWAPRVVAELNDYQFKLVKAQGTFVWHSHEDTDEAFIVLEGELVIEFRPNNISQSRVELRPGELFVVPKGVEHRPVAEREVKVLLLEPRGVVNTGGAGGELQADNDVWV